MTEKLHLLTHQLYQQAYEQPIAQFKSVCFELLSEYFDVDSGTWITRCEKNIPFYNDDSFVYQLPHGFIEDYHHLSTVSTQVHQVFNIMMGNLGKTMDILDVVPDDEWFGSDMYKLYCDKFDLYHSLMTVLMNPLNQAVNIVTFARHDKQKPFSQQNKLDKEFIMPNLIESLRVNILNACHYGTDSSGFRAVCDRYGNIIEAEEVFLSQSEQFKLIQNNKLIHTASEGDTIEANDYKLQFHNYNGLVYTELSSQPIEQQLSGKKRDVCNYLSLGKSNKEIARFLHISPNTVNNHLKSIYKILGVNTRHQAVSYLMRQTWLS